MASVIQYLYYVHLITIITLYFVLSVNGANCKGGWIVWSEVIGGDSNDALTGVYLSNDETVKLAGWTSSTDFLGGTQGLEQPDAWVYDFSNFYGTTRNPRRFSAGADYIYDMYASERYICLAGMSAQDNFVAVLDDLTGSPELLWNATSGASTFDLAYGVTCDAVEGAVIAAGYEALGSNPDVSDATIFRYNITDPTSPIKEVIGGYGDDKASGIAMSGSTLVVVGGTTSPNFPVTQGAFQTAYLGGTDAFITVRDSRNLSATWTTYFGGTDYDVAYDVAIATNGCIYVCGTTNSTDLVMKYPKFANNSGQFDAFVAVFSPQGSLLHSTYYGGSGMDSGRKIAVLDLESGWHFILFAGVAEDGLGLLEKFYAYRGNQDAYVMAYAIDSNYKNADYMFGTYIGSSDEEELLSLSLLPNGVFAIGGTTHASDYPQSEPRNITATEGFYTVFNCTGLLVPSPSPSPTPSSTPSSEPSSVPSNSPSPSSFECKKNCYDVGGTVVQFGTGTDNQPVPTMTLYPQDSSGRTQTQTSLDVSFSLLEERTTNGTSVSSVPIPDSGYTFWIAQEDVEGTNVTTVSFEITLSNGAMITISNYLFQNETQFDFAGFAIPIADSSVKVILNITQWPFESTENTLLLVINYEISPAPSDQPVSTPLTDQVIQYEWTNGISLNRIALVSVAVADGAVVNVTSQVTPSSVEITLPYFTDSLLYDPEYTVLCQDETTDHSNNNKEEVSIWVYIGTFLGVAVVTLIVGLVMLRYVVKRRRRQRERSRKILSIVDQQFNIVTTK